jgi:hypothetical protein
MNPAEQIEAVQAAYRAAVKTESDAAAAKEKALEDLAALRKSTGIAAPSVDETLAIMQRAGAGIFYSWIRKGYRSPRLARKTDRGTFAPVSARFLKPWMVEHVAVDITDAQLGKVLDSGLAGLPLVPEMSP